MKKLTLLLISFLSLFSLASAQQTGGLCSFGNMMTGTGALGTGGAIFGWIFSMLAAVALVMLIFWLFKQIQKK